MNMLAGGERQGSVSRGTGGKGGGGGSGHLRP